MNFDFSQDEKMIRDQVSKFLDQHSDTKVMRSVVDGNTHYSADVWKGLVDMGLTGTAIPEAYGGVGVGYPALCLIAEQLGAHLTPTPFSSSVYLATEAILACGTEAQKEAWLPKLANGEIIGTIAVVETVEEVTETSIQTSVTGNTLTGRKLIVPDGGIADFAIVIARSSGATESNGLSLCIADLQHDSVTRTPIETVDPSKNSTTIDFKQTPIEILGDEVDGWSAVNRIYDRAAILLAFEQIGGAQSALDMAVEYAKERFAFGRPIGSFQGLKHMMADMYVALKLAESNCYYAAWALATESEELPLAAATARVSATQAFQLCSRDNIQVHGGMGFTWEFDCHLYYRRSNYLTLQLGGLATWEDKLVNNLPNAA
ncbi:MAG: acyl-CoA/acyl-ACP dehydrogenase [Pseudomonadales bacterium]|nr:acyl-CoA/acyl-ACP dehydrogenase [Pseudomonadales bacterium]